MIPGVSRIGPAAMTTAMKLGFVSLLVATVNALAEEPLPDVARLKSSPVLQHLRPNPAQSTNAEVLSPLHTVNQMYVPDGFRVDLVAGEPLIHQPIAFAWDHRGRIWLAEAHSYPTRRPEGQGLDKIVILEDRNVDGTFETRTVFAEGLNLVSGLELGFGGVWVGAAPQLLFIPDANQDDVPDGPARILMDGFGYQDTHECLNSFLWGPDGWLYGNQGVFNHARIGRPGSPDSERTELRAGVWRYHPVRHQFEVFAYGGSNPWGLDYDEHGQIFMTHCRSYWGMGCTTHVIQGGHFWNQANANHAPFIIAEPPADFPNLRNYLLASARYDHGAGGAGAPGSDAIYGGHSHVGTMIYLGDNWPQEFRGHLFTHNLGGHQMNHQVNRPMGSGFDTVHAGKDQLFCSDPKYVAVDLQTGPDGAVYFIDWYDRQHCHNPNTERWDRSNGRIYRMAWTATYRPASVHLGKESDSALVGLLPHPNAWKGRMARRLLAERYAAGQKPDPEARAALDSLAWKNPSTVHRLEGLWALHTMGGFPPDAAHAFLKDEDSWIRAWGVQLLNDVPSASPELQAMLVKMATAETSPVVRRHLASAAGRLPIDAAWNILQSLARRAEDRSDRHLPFLIWHSMAPHFPNRVGSAMEIARTTPITELSDWIHWYAASLGGSSLESSLASLRSLSGESLLRRLSGLWMALESRPNSVQPPGWMEINRWLRDSSDHRVHRLADRMASALGDTSGNATHRRILGDRQADSAMRKHAFDVLRGGTDPESLPTFLGLLDDPAFRAPVIRLLSRFNHPTIAGALLDRYEALPAADKAEVLQVLTRRPTFATALLDAVASGRIKRESLTAFHVRQLMELKDPGIEKRVGQQWGRTGRTHSEIEKEVNRLEKVFNEAPLWAYDAQAGRAHFQKLCATCHVLGEEGRRIGPELSGAGKNGIRYYLENILDPNAVVGADFQSTSIETQSGETITGIITSESEKAITVKTVTDPAVVPRSNVIRRTNTEKSLMPEGLLESLNAREQIELLKFLTTH